MLSLSLGSKYMTVYMVYFPCYHKMFSKEVQWRGTWVPVAVPNKPDQFEKFSASQMTQIWLDISENASPSCSLTSILIHILTNAPDQAMDLLSICMSMALSIYCLMGLSTSEKGISRLPTDQFLDCHACSPNKLNTAILQNQLQFSHGLSFLEQAAFLECV